MALLRRSPQPAKRQTRPPKVDPELTAFAATLLESLSRDHPIGYTPELEWRRLRVTAGLAFFRSGKIALSSHILTNTERIELTLRHEYAHLMATARFGRKAAGHGPHWQAAMRELGLEPKVRHSYEVERNRPRQEVVYRCGRCGEAFARRRRLPKRRTFVHAACGGPLKLVEVRTVPADAE